MNFLPGRMVQPESFDARMYFPERDPILTLLYLHLDTKLSLSLPLVIIFSPFSDLFLLPFSHLIHSFSVEVHEIPAGPGSLT